MQKSKYIIFYENRKSCSDNISLSNKYVPILLNIAQHTLTGFKKFQMSAIALRENVLKYLNLYTAVWMICKIFSLIITTVFVAEK